ncbi:glycerophosphodiester phosphodiesterase family protein [Texcoconibacillus texcoconensis]|uniref:Glycerophosphoryl diester phosphodiesterase n=1 Tax=Texcoconibacillus texcoconensis TaxID=1095777 RepID=A0A840QR41_9BACI|nr:glycerophosphoryl diester phosphodiesterase [Texcoconibacillus texcoconensis]
MKIVGHRGNRQYDPENTLAAFQSAWDVGAAGVEFDVQLTKDHEPVIMHDERVDRTTNAQGRLCTFTYRKLRTLDAGSWFHEQFHGERIPHLQEVFEWAEDKPLTLHIELKPTSEDDALIDACLPILERFQCTHKVIISSFHHRLLHKLHLRMNGIETAILTRNPLRHAKQYASDIGAQAIHIRYTYQAANYFPYWKSQGLPTRVYTVNQGRIAKKCRRLGVESLMTDDPQRMINLFR